jgi:hypothetical protein
MVTDESRANAVARDDEDILDGFPCRRRAGLHALAVIEGTFYLEKSDAAAPERPTFPDEHVPEALVTGFRSQTGTC